MSLKVLRDKILVKTEKIISKTASGIYLPENREETDRIGQVEAIGEEVKSVKVGDRIMYAKYRNKIDHEGKTYRVISEENLLLLIEGQDKIQVPEKQINFDMTEVPDTDE